MKMVAENETESEELDEKLYAYLNQMTSSLLMDDPLVSPVVDEPKKKKRCSMRKKTKEKKEEKNMHNPIGNNGCFR